MKFFNIQNQKGFTFVEVIVAVAIVAILATVAFSSLLDVRKKARDTARVSDIEEIRLALRLYKDANGTYPKDIEFKGGMSIGKGNKIDTVLSPFFQTIPKDPLTMIELFNLSMLATAGPPPPSYEYVYDNDYDDCNVAGSNKIILYAKAMERSVSSNWATVCGDVPWDFYNPYVVILGASN